jgi:hypothetical protein
VGEGVREGGTEGGRWTREKIAEIEGEKGGLRKGNMGREREIEKLKENSRRRGQETVLCLTC